MDEARTGIDPYRISTPFGHFVTSIRKLLQKLFDSLGQNCPKVILRPGRESNPCMAVLQTAALPLRHLAYNQVRTTLAFRISFTKS